MDDDEEKLLKEEFKQVGWIGDNFFIACFIIDSKVSLVSHDL